jgi:hypothetical protein
MEHLSVFPIVQQQRRGYSTTQGHSLQKISDSSFFNSLILISPFLTTTTPQLLIFNHLVVLGDQCGKIPNPYPHYQHGKLLGMQAKGPA